MNFFILGCTIALRLGDLKTVINTANKDLKKEEINKKPI